MNKQNVSVTSELERKSSDVKTAHTQQGMTQSHAEMKSFRLDNLACVWSPGSHVKTLLENREVFSQNIDIKLLLVNTFQTFVVHSCLLQHY